MEKKRNSNWLPLLLFSFAIVVNLNYFLSKKDSSNIEIDKFEIAKEVPKKQQVQNKFEFPKKLPKIKIPLKLYDFYNRILSTQNEFIINPKLNSTDYEDYITFQQMKNHLAYMVEVSLTDQFNPMSTRYFWVSQKLDDQFLDQTPIKKVYTRYRKVDPDLYLSQYSETEILNKQQVRLSLVKPKKRKLATTQIHKKTKPSNPVEVAQSNNNDMTPLETTIDNDIQNRPTETTTVSNLDYEIRNKKSTDSFYQLQVGQTYLASTKLTNSEQVFPSSFRGAGKYQKWNNYWGYQVGIKAHVFSNESTNKVFETAGQIQLRQFFDSNFFSQQMSYYKIQVGLETHQNNNPTDEYKSSKTLATFGVGALIPIQDRWSLETQAQYGLGSELSAIDGNLLGLYYLNQKTSVGFGFDIKRYDLKGQNRQDSESVSDAMTTLRMFF